MKALLREPLLHFLILGAMIFAFHAWKGGNESETAEPLRVDISAATIDHLREGYYRQWHRQPDKDELAGLIRDHTREEVLYREALAMGLDRNDTIVRRRMAQKVEFLLHDLAMASTPDDAALTAYFENNAPRYAKPAHVSFRHVYFSRDRRGAKVEADASEALKALAAGASEESIGDPYLREYEFTASDESTIGAALGKEFAAQVMTFPSGQWQGPVSSSYGVHLVIVTERGEPTPSLFADVRDQVLRDFTEERRRTANLEAVAKLQDRYEIEVDESALAQLAVPGTVEATP